MNYDPKILANLVFERGIDSYYGSLSGNNDPDFHSIVLSSQRNGEMFGMPSKNCYPNKWFDELKTDC